MVKITLTKEDIYNLHHPYTLIPALGENKFPDIKKIIWKLDYNSMPYNYTGSIYIKVGDEQIAELKASSLTSDFKVATIVNHCSCDDRCAPLITLNTPITLELNTGAIPPTEGDSNIYIEINYLINEI